MAARSILLALPLLVAGCMAPPKVAAPAPVARPAPPITPPPPPAAPVDWRDRPLSPGSWRYQKEVKGSVARFGDAGATADLDIRCDSVAHTITLSRAGADPGSIAITTSYGTRSWPTVSRGDGRVTIVLQARDPFLDELAFSRARFLVAGPGPARLIAPAWAEPQRVIEDCRA